MAGSDNGGSPLSPRHLIIPGGLTVAAGAAWEGWELARGQFHLEPGSLGHRLGEAGPTLLLAAALATIVIRLTLFVVGHRMGGPPPKLMRQIISLMVWTITAGVLAATAFDIPLGSLVTTSGMMVAVVGIALKNMISDLFTGLSLPVKLGDWIEVDGQLGRVVEVAWRATRLITREDVTVIIPNTHLMARPFRNLSQPTPSYRDSFFITLPSVLPAERIERNLLAAAHQCPEVAAQPGQPDVRIHAFNDRGIEWELRFYVPDADTATQVRFQVQRNLLRNLQYSGIDLPSMVIEMRKAAPLRHDNAEMAFLRGIELFDSLAEDEAVALTWAMSPRTYAVGGAVVTQGDPGESLFILKEGLLAVSITAADGMETVVGQITPGNFFGEMSLLTGAPRSATVHALVESVVYEITRDTMAPLLQSRQELVLQLSEVLAARQLRNAPMLEASRQSVEERKQSLTRQLFAKINTFFRIGEPAGV